jgi:hypothetical protein
MIRGGYGRRRCGGDGTSLAPALIAHDGSAEAQAAVREGVASPVTGRCSS